MRWKIVLLKKPALARETIEADAFGALFRSSFTVKSPQLVLNVSVQALEASSGRVGFFAPPSGLGFGFVTCLQPPAAGCGCVGEAAGVVGADPPAGMSAVLPPPGGGWGWGGGGGGGGGPAPPGGVGARLPPVFGAPGRGRGGNRQ